MTPDVVYVVRYSRHSEELRHSLRSLVNLPHGRVWMAGHMPDWATGVEHIRTNRRPGSHVDAKSNLKAACEHPDVSESFYYFNDDFFVMQPTEELPVMHRGTLADAIAGRMASGYTKALVKTQAVLHKRGIEEPLMYDLHAPMLVTKAGMLEALALCSHPSMQERTLYGNLQGLGGDRRRNYKVNRQEKGWHTWPFLSTNDNSFRTLPVGQYIRSTFPTQSEYEATPAPRERVSPVRVAVGRRPIRRHAGSTIRTIRRTAA